MSHTSMLEDGYTIGLPSPEDADRLTELFCRDMDYLGQPVDREAMRETTHAILDDLGRDNHLFVVRDPEEIVVGMMLLNELISIKFQGRALWIEELYIEEAHRQRGLGRRLVEHCLDWAFDNGYRGVELEAYRMNTAASILYRTLGFRRLARERYSFDIADLEYEEEHE